VPEGDTIAWAANRIRPVLAGRAPDEILTPQPRHAMDRWPERLAGRRVDGVDTHGKHLFIRFEGGLVLHSHLGMSGAWLVARGRRSGWRPARDSGSPGRDGPPSAGWRKAWIVIRAGDCWVVELDGPVLELMTEGRSRFDQRLAGLGPDVLAPQFDGETFLRRLRADDPGRTLGDALLDQSIVAGIGNLWKSESCWEAVTDPWRALSSVSNAQALDLIEAVRPRMLRSAVGGPRTIQPRVYRRHGRPCPRCGTRIEAREQGDANRTTYWCPGCQR
jgi:endonuclease VIII